MKKSLRNRRVEGHEKHVLGKQVRVNASALGKQIRAALGLPPLVSQPTQYEDVRTSMPKGVSAYRQKTGGTRYNPVYTYGLFMRSKGRTGARARMALQVAHKGVRESCAAQWWGEQHNFVRTSILKVPMPVRP